MVEPPVADDHSPSVSSRSTTRPASPNVDATAALTMWINSPEHNKILLTSRWREVGLSAVHVTSAPGTYGGREVTIVTADFGVRR
jgi:uncharacterized protein YkwD